MPIVGRWTGREARALRGALRMSVRSFAQYLGVAVRTVSKWETGNRWVVPQPDTQAILDTALARAEPAAHDRFDALLADDAAHDRFGEVLRSNFGDRQVVSSRTALDMVSVSTNYRHAYRSVPAGALLAATKAHLSLMLSLGPASQPTQVCRFLVRAIGESAVLVAALLGTDLGRRVEAERYLAIAEDAAKENDDSDLTAVILACRAFLISFNNGSPVTASQFANAAVRVASGNLTSSITRAWVTAVSSEHFAALGDEKQTLKRIDDARTALSNAKNDLGWAGFGTFDLVKVTAYEGGGLMRLGRYGEALTRLDEALAGFDASMRRHRCATLIDRAEAHLAAQNIDGCCADASEALRIAIAMEHQVSSRRVRRLAIAVRPSEASAATQLWADVMDAARTRGPKGAD